MTLKGLLRKAALLCCVLMALFSFQMGAQAIASTFEGQLATRQILADRTLGGNAPNSRATANEVKADVKSALDNVAGSGTANKIEGKVEKGYGSAQRSVGHVQNQAEGAAKQLRGNAKQATGKAQNAVEDATESIQTGASDAIDAVKDFFNK